MIKRSVLVSLIFLLYPLYALFGVFALIYRNKAIGYYLLAIFYALFAYFFLPREGMDLATHYERFAEFSSMNLAYIFELWGIKYFATYAYAWSLMQLGFSKAVVPFSFTLIGYLILFDLFRDILKSNTVKENKNVLFILFLIVLLNISFLGLANGLRSTLSSHIVVSAIYYYIYHDKIKRFYILSLISIAIHPLAVAPIVLFITLKLFKKREIYRFLLYSALLLFVFSELFFYQIAYLLKPILVFLNLYSASYFEIDGAWGGAISEHRSWKGYIFDVVFSGSRYYLMIAYLILVTRSEHKELFNYLCMFVFFLALISTAYSVHERYAYFFTVLFSFFFILDVINKPISKLKATFMYLLLGTLILYNAGMLYSYNDVFFSSVLQFLIKPLPILLFYN